MQIRCPHCHQPIEIVDDSPLSDFTCPACGSTFSLISDDTETIHWHGAKRIAHFELLDQVGQGAFGVVWKARDTVLDRITGGLTVMSSITPAVGSSVGRRPSSPTQTPYFRVLIKGERIASKPGRADDTTWPRPEPPPVAEAAPAAEPAAPQPRVRRSVKPPG